MLLDCSRYSGGAGLGGWVAGWGDMCGFTTSLSYYYSNGFNCDKLGLSVVTEISG